MLGSYGLQTHIWNNRLKSLLLLAGFPLLLLLITFGFAVLISAFSNPSVSDGLQDAVDMLPSLIPIAFGAALVWFLISWFANGAMIAAVTHARGVDRTSEPRLWNLLENLCISRGITMPKLRIIETDARNAFASGVREKQYSITVTRGLMDALNDAELEAVLAHELTHIRNRDVQLLVIAAVFVGVISLAGDLLIRSPRMIFVGGNSRRSSNNRNSGGGAVVLILIAVAIFVISRFLGIALRFAMSRKREYLADAGSAELTKNPDAMISALQRVAGHSDIKAPAQVQEMFLDHEHKAGLSSLFDSHPPIEKRIAALVKFAGGQVRPLPPEPVMSVDEPASVPEVEGRRSPLEGIPPFDLPGTGGRGPWNPT